VNATKKSFMRKVRTWLTSPPGSSASFISAQSGHTVSVPAPQSKPCRDQRLDRRNITDARCGDEAFCAAAAVAKRQIAGSNAGNVYAAFSLQVA
jgi:hypothetical protein